MYEQKAIDYLYDALDIIDDRFMCLTSFNDNANTTHDQIMKLYDRAISLAKENSESNF